mmetsp:Transcript_11176/g.32202  ORF Transcript_11176/g.32202 Transcript_11176/m.32202 type:complete len:787 (+) Transcript_11176:41-2401(+)
MLDGSSGAPFAILGPHGDEALIAACSLKYSHADLHAATRGFAEENRLGAGAAGVVYRGTIRGGTDVAVKVVQAQAAGASGFEDELRVLSCFRHPNLVTLLGWGQDGAVNGRRYLVYELLTGGDLARRLRRSRLSHEPFPWQQRLRAASDAACGLSHMINSNPKAFHRDIKPQNILLDGNGTAKVADFGLAATIKETGRGHLTVDKISGTPGYADPAYIQSGRVTEQSEVYSFGTVLLELLLNEPPAACGPRGEIVYPLVQIVQPAAPGALARIATRLDCTASWPQRIADGLAQLALACVAARAEVRPTFEMLVERLRHLRSGDALETPSLPPTLTGEAFTSRSSRTSESVRTRSCGLGVRHVPSWGEGPLRLPDHVMWGDDELDDESFPHRDVTDLGCDADSAVGSSDSAGDDAIETVLAGNRQPLAAPSLPPTQPPSLRKILTVTRRLVAPDGRCTKQPEDSVAEVVFECVYAKGVDASALPPRQRAWGFAVGAQQGRFVIGVGRQCQQHFFEALLPGRSELASISRKHFEMILTAGGSSEPIMVKRCSDNPMVVDSRQLDKDASAPLRSGSSIGFLGGFGQPPFLVLRVLRRSVGDVARFGAHPCAHGPTLSPAPPVSLVVEAERPCLECTYAQGQGAALSTMPWALRSIPLPDPGQSMTLGRQDQHGFLDHLLRAEPGWLAFLSRRHCRLTVPPIGSGSNWRLTVENLSSNVVCVAGKVIAKGQESSMADGDSLVFVARHASDVAGEQEILRLTLRTCRAGASDGAQLMPDTVVKVAGTVIQV